MDVKNTDIPGCRVVLAKVLRDKRGSFVKTFQKPRFTQLGLRTDWQEEYFSTSVADVVRGMHFQMPPADHAKLVFCVFGEVLDVVVDLRHGSPTFGQPRAFSLTAVNGRGIYIPSGCAHGFVSLSEVSAMYYKVTSVYSPQHDAGIAWDSIGFDWPASKAALSDRDLNHPRLADFESPFTYKADEASR